MPDNITMGELYAQFEEFALVQGTTKKKCRAAIRKLMAWKLELKPADMTSMHVEAWQAWMDSRLSNASVRSYFGAASQVFGWAHKHKLIPDNPFREADKVAKQEKEVCTWPTEEIKDLSDAASVYPRMDPTARTRWVAMIDLAAYSGLRVGEIWNLRWDDIDLDNEIVTVRHRDDLPEVHWTWGSKGKKDRQVPIFENALFALYRLKNIATWKYPFLKEKTCTRLQSMVGALTEDQRKYPYCNFYRELRQIKAFADGIRLGMGKQQMTNGCMHVLRHTAVSRWLAGGRVSVKEAQTIAGHASELTTLRIYAHTTNREALDNVRKSLIKH